MSLQKISWLPMVGAVLLIWLVPLAMDPINPIVRSFVLPKLFVFYICLALMAGGLLLQPDLSGVLQRGRFPRAILWLGVLWLVWLSLTAIGGVFPIRSWIGSYHWQLGVVTQIALWSSSFLVFLAGRTEKTAVFLWRLSVLGSVPILLYGTVQYFQLEPIEWYRWGDAGPVMATLGNENHLGAYLALVMPLTLMKFLITSQRVWRIGLGVLFVWQFSILLATHGVGAWVGAGVACLLVLWWHWRFVWGQAVVVLVVLVAMSIGATIFVSSQGDSIGESLRQQGITRELRPFTWATAWGAVAARPWWGWGSSSFEFTQARHASPKFREYIFPMDRLMDRAHNLWLELAVETGLPGLILWLTLIATIGFSGLRGASELSAEAKAFVLSGVAAAFAYLLYQVVNPSELATAVLFYWLLGMILGVSFPGTEEMMQVTNVHYARLTLMLMCLGAWLGVAYAFWQWWVIG